LPEKVVTNFDLEKLVDTSDEWITKRTGISTRRIVTNETAIGMAADAATKALDMAGIDKNDVGLIVGCTFTSEQLTPAMASYVAKVLGIASATMDISAGCTGFISGIITAASLMDSLGLKAAIVVSSETLSKFVDWTDRSTCVLFGDGAGAVVLQRSETPRLHYPILNGVPDVDDVLILHREKRQTPFCHVDEFKNEYIRMDGREVFTYAVGAVEDALNCMMQMCGDKPYTKVIPHQANEKIIDYVIRKTGLSKEQFFINIDKYANTSSATIPIAICDAYAQGWLNAGERIALVGFGSGLSCGGIVIDWTL
jgi:3-oxoacyl-[acyl-carrier-protein] synthase-3